MSELVSSQMGSWVPLVALLWLASVAASVVSMRRYFASRAFDRCAIARVSARETVRERIARDPASAEGLRELARALYLDQSSFRFGSLAELSPEDRSLAKDLIEEWLAAPSALDDWEETYRYVSKLQPTPAPRQEPALDPGIEAGSNRRYLAP